MAKLWKKGRGKLGFMDPLLGRWVAESDTPMGPVRCTRHFEKFGESWVKLEAAWEFGVKTYREIALIGVAADRKVGFWSFTNDGKRSQGTVADVTDLHAEAIGFEAQMDAGFARMAYWPDGEGGFFWWSSQRRERAGNALRITIIMRWMIGDLSHDAMVAQDVAGGARRDRVIRRVSWIYCAAIDVRSPMHHWPGAGGFPYPVESVRFTTSDQETLSAGSSPPKNQRTASFSCTATRIAQADVAARPVLSQTGICRLALRCTCCGESTGTRSRLATASATTSLPPSIF